MIQKKNDANHKATAKKRKTLSLRFYILSFTLSVNLLKDVQAIQFTTDSSPTVKTIIRNDFVVNDDTIGGCDQTFPSIVATNNRYILIFIDNRSGYNQDVYCCIFDTNFNIIQPPFIVNDDTLGANQKNPKVAADSLGNFVIVWLDNRGSSEDDVYGQRYNAQGIPIGRNFKINDDGGEARQENVEIDITPSGRFVVVWQDYRNVYPDIYFQIFSETGSPIGGNRIANDIIQGYQVTPDIAIDREGNFSIVWFSANNIHLRMFDKNGSPLGNSIKVNNIATRTKDPQIYGNYDGKIIVAWRDWRISASWPFIFAQLYDSLGKTSIGSNFCLHNTSVLKWRESISISYNGNFIIAWSEKTRSDFSVFPDIYGQICDTMGNLIGNNFKVGDTSCGELWNSYSSIAVNKNNNFIIIWENKIQRDVNILCQKYNRQGNRIGNNFILIPDKGFSSQKYSKTAMGKDIFVITWIDSRYNKDAIFAQIFNLGGSFIGNNILISDTATKADKHSIAIDKLNNFIIAWAAWRVGSFEICAAKFNENGNIIISAFPVIRADYLITNPNVACDSLGNFVVVWQGYKYDWKQAEIFAKLFNKNGYPIIDTAFMVNDTIGECSYHPYVGMNSEGDFIVVWQEGTMDMPMFDIYGQRFSKDGTRIRRNFKINDDALTQTNQFKPSIDIKDSIFVVVWEDMRNNNCDIYCQIYDTTGNPIGRNIKVNDDVGNSLQKCPSVTINDDSCFLLVTWTDYRNRRPQIFAQNISFDGSLIGENFMINDTLAGDHIFTSSSSVDYDNNYVVFTWTDNRRKKSLDIYAKLGYWGYWGYPNRIPKEKNIRIGPMPTRNVLNIDLSIAKESNYKIFIYDKCGRNVYKHNIGKLSPGIYNIRLNVSNLVSDIYFIKIIGKEITFIEKVIVLR